MSIAKFWDGTTWQAISNMPGPQGPPGPQATGSIPGGPAGGGLVGTYPDPYVLPSSVGGLLAVQRAWGLENAYKAISSGQPFTVNAAGGWLQIFYTPTVECYWEVNASIGILQKTDAAYHYSYAILRCSPADADGFGDARSIEMQHNTNIVHQSRAVSRTYRLSPGVAYNAHVVFESSGGGWQFHTNYQYLWLQGKVWAA